MAASLSDMQNELNRLMQTIQQQETELDIINSIQQALASRLDVQSIYDLVGEKIREIFNAQVVMLSTYDSQTDTMEHRYAIECGVRVYAPGRFPVRGFRTQIVQTRAPVLVNSNVAEQAANLGQPTLPGTITPKSWLGVPMLVGNQVTGILSLQNVEQEDAFTDANVRLLETLAATMSVALENARLGEQEKLYTKALEHEFEVGREIQAGFLPDVLPHLVDWEIAASLHPAREVAGDFYDVFCLPDGNIGLVIADVCDKGLGAALYMTLFRSFIRAAANRDFYTRVNSKDELKPAERLLNAITLTNNYIAETHGDTGMFATIFFGILDIISGKLFYINAGHLPPILLNSQGKVQSLTRTGPGVGASPDATYEIHDVVLAKQDTFFACTDGLTEVESTSGEPFMEKSLIPELTITQPLTSCLENIRLILERFSGGLRQMDDITMLAIRRKENTGMNR